jgi:hypothetical protein
VKKSKKAHVLAPTPAVTADMLAKRDLLKVWASHPWNFLTGKNLDGAPIILTSDEIDDNAPVKPFPQWDYLKILSDIFYRQKDPILINKARQMMATTVAMLCAHWFCLFIDNRSAVVSKSTESEGKVLIRDKVRSVHARMPQWVREALPISDEPADRIDYTDTKSTMTGATQNVSTTQARGRTPSIIIVDEAAFQERFGDIYTAARPINCRLWCLTTANMGNPGAEVFERMLRSADRDVPVEEMVDDARILEMARPTTSR